MAAGAGAMREQLVVQTSAPRAFSLASLTSAGTTATATTPAAHGYTSGDYVTIAGATPAGYNGRVLVTVTGALTFTYVVAAGLVTPATGTKTATYASDSQGGRAVVWRTVATVFAALVSQRAGEQLRTQSIGAQVDVQFRVRVRGDLTEKMRVLWTPTWPIGAAQQTLEVHGLLLEGDGRTHMFIECGRVS